MAKYHKNHYIQLSDAINDAANWTQFATPEELDTIIYSELKPICIQRCLEKHEDVVNDLKIQIDKLSDDIRDDETYYQYEKCKLTRQISSLENIIVTTTFPSKTLIDIEKIEFIKENWDKLTYDNLKATLTKQPDNIIIENLYDEIDSLSDEVEILNMEVEFLKDKLNR
jgi:hypothetical protein